MKYLNSGKHLIYEERKNIETGIKNGATKTAIWKTIRKKNLIVGKITFLVLDKKPHE